VCWIRAGRDRVALVLIRVQEALRGGPVDHPGQLPAQIHRVPDAKAEALPARGVMHVRRVASEQDPSRAVGRRLPGHVGEPGDPGGVVDPEVGAVDRDQRLAQIAQGGLATGPELALGHDHPHRFAVLHRVEGVDAGGVVADARRRLLGRFDLGDQIAPGRVPAWELDAGCFADEAASAVAADEIPGPQRLATRQLDVDAGVVLREPGRLNPVVDPHRQFGDPGGHDPLDLVLPDPERVRMTRREVAHVEHGRGQHRGLGRLALGEEAIGNPALIQQLDRARVKAARP
jgi:hypothetical protein